jgi:hypothetical protein
LGFSPEYARRLSERVQDETVAVIRALERMKCHDTLRSPYYDLLVIVSGILTDFLVMGTSISAKVREHEEVLDERISELRDKYPAPPPRVRREIERLERMKITGILGKPPDDISLGDLVSLLRLLAGKLLTLCFYEQLRKEEERKTEKKTKAGEEEAEEEEEEAEEEEEEG